MNATRNFSNVILKTLRFGFFFVLLLQAACTPPTDKSRIPGETEASVRDSLPAIEPLTYQIRYDVPIRVYFEFMDSLVAHLDTILNYPVSEHLIVRSNPWLIDSLENTDYYRLKAKGIFNEDPQSLLALRKGVSLLIPDTLQAEALKQKMAGTLIDVNIPEFRLRIIENGKQLYSFPVRVGQVAKKYLAMAGRKVDLRTKTGSGTIVRINRNPAFINPSDNKRYYRTRRDDGKITKLPRIPWIEPELNGHRFGQLIHPTTNPKTLGKAYSNGCIGMSEADMWRVYYHAPVGTKVVFRYELKVVNDQGDTTILKNIYPGYEHSQKRREIIAAAVAGLKDIGKGISVCECGTIRQ